MTEHTAACRWERTTLDECEYRATHHYCPHPEHRCDCVSPAKKLDRIVAHLEGQAAESPFTREEWDRVDKRAVELESENKELRSKLDQILSLARNGTPDAETRGDEDGHYAQGQIDMYKEIKRIIG